MENFDLIAKDFDTKKRIERAAAVADEIRLHIRNGGGKSAVEYGCGTGLVGFSLIDDFDGILFVDSSPGMIEQVKEKLIKLGKPADSAICFDLMENSDCNFKADYIFMSLVLHHIKDTEEALIRLYNILNEGGRLLIADLNPDDGSFHANYPNFDGHNGFEQSELAGMAERAGFMKAECKTFYFDSKVTDGKKSEYSLFILDAEKA